MSHPQLNIPHLYQNPVNKDGYYYKLDILIYLQNGLTIERVHGKFVDNYTYTVIVEVKKNESLKDHYEFTHHQVPAIKGKKLEVIVSRLNETEPVGKNTIAIRDFNEDDESAETS